ncbi:alpha/beta fold hydrolase [Achromobacter sp. UMC71]|uniref:alpha/beta fold hydrolase n=1 Tax=Achromobacter sp. UMC71 TaxID=1862320 RepID=UPI0015FFC98C|nr:alpha/beta hydrolase [Achromobacter sp. UMC71]MBB1626458.1 alpha/beta hydrolase [Achromobacter sp. UMC71]
MHSRFEIACGRAVLAADAVGSGDPVVFLHASICDRRMWRPQLESLGAAGCQAIAYDRRGFGDTRGQAEDHSAVADLMAVIDTVADGKPAILVGCSQGARIAMDAALMHPAAVRGLVLISPTVAGSPEVALPPTMQALMAPLKAVEAAGDLDGVNRLKARLFLDGPLAAEGRVAGAVREQFLDMHGRALRAAPMGASRDDVAAYSRLREFTAPALVIWGDLDFPHIQERARRVAGILPQGEACASAGAAHLPSLDHPADITARIAAFIGRCPGGAGASSSA